MPEAVLPRRVGCKSSVAAGTLLGPTFANWRRVFASRDRQLESQEQMDLKATPASFRTMCPTDAPQSRYEPRKLPKVSVLSSVKYFVARLGTYCEEWHNLLSVQVPATRVVEHCPNFLE